MVMYPAATSRARGGPGPISPVVPVVRAGATASVGECQPVPSGPRV